MHCRSLFYVLGSLFVFTFAGVTAEAHHSVAGMYDTSQETRISGVVVQFQFVHPHPLVVVDTQRDGTTERWTLEMDNRGELAHIGFSDSTLKPGDQVSVRGSLARREPRRLYIMRLDRKADGFAYEQIGSRPQIVK